MVKMKDTEIIAKLMRIHYYLMDNPRLWYDKGLLDASRIVCVIASDMRLAAKNAPPAGLLRQ